MLHVQAAMYMLPQYVHWDFVTTMYACFLYMGWIYIIATTVDMCCFRNNSEKLYIRSCIALVKFSSCLRLKSFRIGRMKTRPLPITLFSSLGDWAMAADMGSKHVLRPCGWHLSSTIGHRAVFSSTSWWCGCKVRQKRHLISTSLSWNKETLKIWCRECGELQCDLRNRNVNPCYFSTIG